MPGRVLSSMLVVLFETVPALLVACEALVVAKRP
jgi:hypothetical protein